ncbi:hypothetical protein NVP2275O_033 [Vibrio phage 2.275.O._10N.286.54.E11]|nr:hypothetical protein NVP2275O_033 [Vibrio phage 2.275.O._10N.286.54.E11]
MKEDDAVQLIKYLLSYAQTLMEPNCNIYHPDELSSKTKIFLDSVDIVIENWYVVPVALDNTKGNAIYELTAEFHKHIKLPAMC